MATSVLTPTADDVAGTRAELLEARHLPGYFYHVPELYQMEIEKIFMKDWLCIGRIEQWEKTIRPTFNLFARYDLIQPWVSLPVGPEKTQITIWTQFSAENFEMPAFEAKSRVYKDFIRVVAGEDVAMLRSLQQGIKSRNFAPGPTVELEKGIHHLLNYHLDRMFGEPGNRHDR